jgi:hypothetical protein
MALAGDAIFIENPVNENSFNPNSFGKNEVAL